jgi:hypothetical protein
MIARLNFGKGSRDGIHPINLRVNLCRPPLAPFGPLLNFDGRNL